MPSTAQLWQGISSQASCSRIGIVLPTPFSAAIARATLVQIIAIDFAHGCVDIRCGCTAWVQRTGCHTEAVQPVGPERLVESEREGDRRCPSTGCCMGGTGPAMMNDRCTSREEPVVWHMADG